MRVNIETNDEEKAKRLLHCDEVFSLLYNINLNIRNELKFKNNKLEDVLKQIQEDINESNLLNLYN